MTWSFATVWVTCMVAALLVNAVSVMSIPRREYDSMLSTVRTRGYDLFCNAITTSDLQMDLLFHQSDANNSDNNSRAFTVFAPTDASLFALDMTQTASFYTDTLRFHVVPRRLSLAQLRLLPDGYELPTLLPQHSFKLTRRSPSATIAVGGVDVAFPGLFYGHNVAVHGLAGILSRRSKSSNNFPSPSPANQPVLAPVPSIDSFNVTNQRGSPPVEAPAPAVTTRESSVSPVDAPETEPDWTVYPPTYPDSEISLPPEGYSDVEAPAPESLESTKRCLIPDEGSKEPNMQCYAA